jgi:hypothetical protein
MLIKLTNANPQLDGELVVLNSEHIITMFEETILKGTAAEHRITNVYIPPHGTWQVKESLEDICAKLTEDPNQHLTQPHVNARGNITVIKENVTESTAVEILDGVTTDKQLDLRLKQGLKKPKKA